MSFAEPSSAPPLADPFAMGDPGIVPGGFDGAGPSMGGQDWWSGWNNIGLQICGRRFGAGASKMLVYGMGFVVVLLVVFVTVVLTGHAPAAVTAGIAQAPPAPAPAPAPIPNHLNVPAGAPPLAIRPPPPPPPALPSVCVWQIGFAGSGGERHKMGMADTPSACEQLVRAGYPASVGASYLASTADTRGAGSCYAETIGADGAGIVPNEHAAWQFCPLTASAVPPPPPGPPTSGSVTGCVFGMGDGTGGTDQSAGRAATKEACVSLVQVARPIR